MRVTNRYIANNMISNLQNNLARLAGTQEQISTSKRVNRPSDDPNVMSQLMGIKGSLMYNEQYDRNLDDGLAYLDMNDAVMGSVGDALTKAYELTVQGANDTYNAEDRTAIAEQIDKMIDQMVDLGNASVGNKYIFAGTDNADPPFKRVGDVITFSGAIDQVVREVSAHTEYPINSLGVTTTPATPGVFGSAVGTAPGPYTVYDSTAPAADLANMQGVFRVMFDLRDRLNANNTAGLESSIDELQNTKDTVLQKRVAVGARYSHFESLKKQLLNQNINLSSSLSNIEDADMSKLSIEAAQQQLSYQASLAIGANMMQTSLLDFLK